MLRISIETEKKLMRTEKDSMNGVKKNRDLRRRLFCVFFGRIGDAKLRRKIVKRPTMTLAYGGTRYGFGEQVYDDSADLSAYLSSMDKIWSSQMGSLLYDVCFDYLHDLLHY